MSDEIKPRPVTHIERIPLRKFKGGNPNGLRERRFQRTLPLGVKKNKNRHLSHMQQVFLEHYTGGKTYAESCRLAGYSESTAGSNGAILIGKVKDEVARVAEKNFKKLEIKNERVIEEAGALAFSNMMDFIRVNQETGSFSVDLRNVTREQAAAIQELTYDTNGRPKIKLHDKKGSIELLGKFLKMFADRVEISGAGGQPLTIQYLDKVIQNIHIESSSQLEQQQPPLLLGEDNG